MPALMNMPEVTANAMEATLSTWLKCEGDTVAAGESIAEVETEKATVEIEAESDGVIARLLVEVGANVEVGAPILVIKGEGDTDAQLASLLDSIQGQSSGTAAKVAVAHAETTPAEAVEANTPVVQGPISGERSITPAPITVDNGDDHNRVFASPLARRTARENQLDVTAITGTGPGGRIVRRDVEKALATESAAPALVEAAPDPSNSTAEAGVSRQHAREKGADRVSLPHTKMRRAIARRLTESKTTVPHFYLSADVKMDALLHLRKQINAASTRRITVNDFVVKAAGLALQDVPEANVIWTEDAQLQYTTSDISVAIAVDGGLLTPVVANVASRSITSISTEISDFLERAKRGTIRQDELIGGSFSVSNLGMFGTKQFSAILNPPQSAILAVGAAEQRPIAEDGELKIATVMTCTLSADHRVIDGAVAAQWMNAFTSRVENPLTILV